MKTANTGAFFGRRDAGRDISKTIPLVKLAHKSFMDAITRATSSYIESLIFGREASLQL